MSALEKKQSGMHSESGRRRIITSLKQALCTAREPVLKHMYTLTHLHTLSHSHIYIHTHSPHTHIHLPTHPSSPLTFTLTHTPTYTHAHTFTHTPTYTHTQPQPQQREKQISLKLKHAPCLIRNTASFRLTLHMWDDLWRLDCFLIKGETLKRERLIQMYTLQPCYKPFQKS